MRRQQQQVHQERNKMTKKEREKPVSTEKQQKSESQKAKESLDFWLAKIETRALIALAKGQKDV